MGSDGVVVVVCTVESPAEAVTESTGMAEVVFESTLSWDSRCFCDGAVATPLGERTAS